MRFATEYAFAGSSVVERLSAAWPVLSKSLRNVQDRWNGRDTVSAEAWQTYLEVSPSVIAKSPAHASAFDLQAYALKRLAGLRQEGDADPTEEALSSLTTVLTKFVCDNGPTPQLGATASGSVEIQWLAAGTLVSALFDESGEVNLYSTDSNDDVLFDVDVPDGNDVEEELVRLLSGTLSEMGNRVVKRPASWF